MTSRVDGVSLASARGIEVGLPNKRSFVKVRAVRERGTGAPPVLGPRPPRIWSVSPASRRRGRDLRVGAPAPRSRTAGRVANVVRAPRGGPAARAGGRAPASRPAGPGRACRFGGYGAYTGRAWREDLEQSRCPPSRAPAPGTTTLRSHARGSRTRPGPRSGSG